MTIKNTVKQKRLENKLSQEDLSKLADLSFRTIQIIENNKCTNPQLQTCFAIKKALKVQNLEELFYEED